MSEIQDQGKVWLRGQVKPLPAVKFAGKIIIPDLEHGELADFWGTERGLCVDLHIKDKRIRVARWFPNEIQEDSPGTLFSGFDNTKHADILAVLPDNPAILESIFSGDKYSEVETMNPKAFFELANPE